MKKIIAILFLISILVLIISFLCIRFTLISKIEEDGIDKTHIFCYQNNETGQSFWKTLGVVKRDDVFVYSLSKNKE